MPTPIALPWPKGEYVCVRCEKQLKAANFKLSAASRYVDDEYRMTCRACHAVDEAKKLAEQVAERKVQNKKKAAVAKKKAQQAGGTTRGRQKKEEARERRVAQREAASKVRKLAKIQETQLEPQVAAQRELASRELARRSLLHYTERNVPEYEAGWIHEDICRRLEQFMADVEARRSPRLMLWMPPRHGKSEIASTQFPGWVLGHHPEWEFISTSYSADLPMGFSRKIRARVAGEEHKALFPSLHLSRDSQSAESWRTTRGGGFRAAGVGGGITGMGAHILVIDDPVKDQEEADSETVREKVWAWFGSTAYTRLAPGGGVLIIQCMTGDTGVLMADGTEKRLSDVRPGDEVATYDDGELRTSTVLNWASQGHDNILKITTSSGKVVKANGRHPFLTLTDGELVWTRAKNLQPTQQIVTVKGSGVNGKGRPVPKKGARRRSPLADFVRHTTTKLNGLLGIDLLRLTLILIGERILSTGTESPLKRLISSSKTKMVSALSAANHLMRGIHLNIGQKTYVSTTATRQAKCARCCATPAISSSVNNEVQRPSKPPPGMSDFMLETVSSVEAAGIEEVFDIEVDRTHNFIANGVTSSNTRWHDDDLSGRVERVMNEGLKEYTEVYADAQRAYDEAKTPEQRAEAKAKAAEARQLHDSIDRWEIIKYPAIATHDEYLDIRRGSIITDIGTHKVEERRHFKPLRKKGEALHPERFPVALLNKYKRTLQPRHWHALYQQNPVPDEGMFFVKDMLRFRPTMPDWREMHRFVAWDLAIGQKHTNDWTVGIVGAIDWDDNLWILDMIRGRWPAHQIAQNIVDTSVRYEAMLTGIEKGQLELAIMPQIRRVMKERGVYIPLAEGKEALRPITDKVMRARPLQGRMQQGKVIFPMDQPWVETATNELLRFPTGLHDDIVDAMAWLVRLVMHHEPPARPRAADASLPKGFTSWKDRLKSLTGDKKNFMSR